MLETVWESWWLPDPLSGHRKDEREAGRRAFRVYIENRIPRISRTKRHPRPTQEIVIGTQVVNKEKRSRYNAIYQDLSCVTF